MKKLIISGVLIALAHCLVDFGFKHPVHQQIIIHLISVVLFSIGFIMFHNFAKNYIHLINRKEDA